MNSFRLIHREFSSYIFLHFTNICLEQSNVSCIKYKKISREQEVLHGGVLAGFNSPSYSSRQVGYGDEDDMVVLEVKGWLWLAR